MCVSLEQGEDKALTWLAFLAMLFLNYWGGLMSCVQLQLLHTLVQTAELLLCYLLGFTGLTPRTTHLSVGWLTTTEP